MREWSEGDFAMAAANRVLIVGSGIVGQSLAVGLARRGIECEIVEIKESFDIVGAGILIQGTGMRAFDEIGVGDDVREVGWSERTRVTFRDVQENIVAAVEAGDDAGPLPGGVSFERQVLHEKLAGLVAREAVPVRMGTTVETIDDGDDAVAVTFTDGTSGAFDLVVGCDGIHSRVRAMVFGVERPEYSGFVAWRYILPRPAGLNEMVWYWGRVTTIGVVPIAEDLIYLAGTSAEPGNPWFEREKLPEIYRERFSEYDHLIPELLAQVTEPDKVVATPMEQVILPPPWHKGRVAVMGDAAHATCPFWAQGASMGIEDAALLMRFLTEGDDLDDVLGRWFERRYPRCMMVQKGSYETGKMSHRHEGDGPKVLPPPVRDMIQQQMKDRLQALAAPY